MNIFSKVIDTAFPETWHCAIRFNKNENTSILNNIKEPFTVLPNTRRYWCADPFLIFESGKYYMFFEAFDRLKRKGVLGVRNVFKSGISPVSCGPIKVIYEAPFHLSFPFIFKKGGIYYIIPESAQSGRLFRIKCTSFPYKWEYDCEIAREALADTVFYESSGVKYYISEKFDGSNIYDKVDLFYDDGNGFTECENNPVKHDISNARGAGKIFNYDGKLIRPAQDCGASYGSALNFNEVLSISKSEMVERALYRISCSDIKTNSVDRFCGIHTYNSAGCAEVIDLKSPGRFDVLNFAGALGKESKKIISCLKR